MCYNCGYHNRKGGRCAIKLLIADDERVTREGLFDCITSANLGFSEIRTAGNGQAAYELATQMRPDVLLCDIRMPKMNGVNLAVRLRAEQPDIQILFISGYADKAYLKAAIALQAGGYIEKPINEDELITLLKKTLHKLAEQRRQQRRSGHLAHQADLFLRRQLILALAKSPRKLPGLLAPDSELNRTWRDAGNYQCACIHLQWSDTLSAQFIDEAEHDIVERLEAELSARADIRPECALCGVLTTRQLGITLCRVRLRSSALEAFLEGAMASILASYPQHVSVYVCCAPACERIEELAGCYQDAAHQAKWMAFTGQKSTIGHHARSTPLYVPEDQSAAFSELLRRMAWPEAQALLLEQTQHICKQKHGSIDETAKYYEKLLSLCVSADPKRLFPSQRGLMRISPFSSFSHLRTLGEMSHFIAVRINELMHHVEVTGELSPKIEQAIGYIEQNLGRASLSIQSIAESLSLTETYLCALYKRETGMTLHKTITDIRIRRAQALLLQGTNPSEVAQLVGYSDAGYFGSVFKKHTGFSMAAYRRSGLEGDGLG